MDFVAKVKTIKESYFSKKTTESVIDESLDDEAADSEVEVSPMMEQYLKAIRNSNK